MNSLVIILIGMVALSAGYLFYGRWLAKRWGWIYQCAESACPVFWKSPVRKEEIMVSDR